MKIFWFIPTHGDSRYLGTSKGARQLNHDYLKQVAVAADSLGYEGVLIPTGRSCEDPWVVAASLLPVTRNLKFLVAVRPGLHQRQRLGPWYAAGRSQHPVHLGLHGPGLNVHPPVAAALRRHRRLEQARQIGGRRHVDTRLGIDHIGRDTACELTWRGLGAGRGRAVFHGGILIREGADGTDAALSNKNLLLSDNAEIDTQPVLEIHADEVKAAHGATVGQLDANALFYLRSRGLTQAEARQLLTTAFCREPLGVIAHAGVREALLARVDAALAALEAP